MEDDFSILYKDLPQQPSYEEFNSSPGYQTEQVQGPTDTREYTGIAFVYLILFAILGIVGIVGLIALPVVLILGPIGGGSIDIRGMLGLTSMVLIAISSSIYAVVRLLRKKTLFVGPSGVQLKIKTTVIFDIPWDHINMIYSKPSGQQSLAALGMITKRQEKIEITTFGIAYSKLREAFHYMEQFCPAHMIRVANDDRW